MVYLIHRYVTTQTCNIIIIELILIFTFPTSDTLVLIFYFTYLSPGLMIMDNRTNKDVKYLKIFIIC